MTPDTAMGGARGDFPSTLWTDIALTRENDEAKRRTAWEGLANAYWKPIYVYMRAAWSKSSEEAKDLTQDFFAWMMETGFPGRADPRRGRFRVFVKTALRHFLGNEARASHRLKRGGGRPVLMLDRSADDLSALELPGPAGGSPEEVLEKAWKAELLARARNILEEAFRREGKQVYYDLFRDCVLGASPGLTHAEAATKYAIAASDVNNHLMASKKRFREILTDLVAETVSGGDELRDELKELFGGTVP